MGGVSYFIFASGLERSSWISVLIILLIGCGGYILLLRVIQSSDAPIIMRTSIVKYEAAQFELRMLFKDKHIHFRRKAVDKSHRFEFPLHNLILITEPYDFNTSLWFRLRGSTNGTLFTLRHLNTQNSAFTQQLTQEIDSLIAQQTKT